MKNTLFLFCFILLGCQENKVNELYSENFRVFYTESNEDCLINEGFLFTDYLNSCNTDEQREFAIEQLNVFIAENESEYLDPWGFPFICVSYKPNDYYHEPYFWLP